MDNLADLLAKKDFSELPEIKVIKDYVSNKYDEVIEVMVDKSKITIFVKSSALSNSIRMDVPELQRLCKTDKRFVIYLN